MHICDVVKPEWIIGICFTGGEGKKKKTACLGRKSEACLSGKLFHIALDQRKQIHVDTRSGWSAKGK